MFKRRRKLIWYLGLILTKKVVGSKQVKGALAKGEAKVVYIAQDADEKNSKRYNSNMC